MQVIQGDLFQVEGMPVVHCVSADAAMGAGIAKIFRQRFPEMPKKVKRMKPEVGDVVAYEERNWCVLNMVTKQKYWHKPTREAMGEALDSLAAHCKQQGISEIAMPKIGAGLDKLSWGETTKQIDDLLSSQGITVHVYVIE